MTTNVLGDLRTASTEQLERRLPPVCPLAVAPYSDGQTAHYPLNQPIQQYRSSQVQQYKSSAMFIASRRGIRCHWLQLALVRLVLQDQCQGIAGSDCGLVYCDACGELECCCLCAPTHLLTGTQVMKLRRRYDELAADVSGLAQQRELLLTQITDDKAEWEKLQRVSCPLLIRLQ